MQTQERIWVLFLIQISKLFTQNIPSFVQNVNAWCTTSAERIDKFFPKKDFAFFLEARSTRISIKWNFRDRLCPSAKLFLREYDNNFVNGTCVFKVIEVVHKPVAFQVFYLSSFTPSVDISCLLY